MKRVIIAAWLLSVGSANPVAAADDGPWLPLKKADVIRLLAESGDVGSVKVSTLEQVLADVRRSSKQRASEIEAEQAELTRHLAPDDQVWIVTNPGPGLEVVLAGRDENVHSLRVGVGTLDQGKVNRAFAVVSAIYGAVYPAWTEAKEWPVESLREAWNKSPLNEKRPPLQDANDLIVKRSIDGITSATFGVPPDFVIYAITTRKQCIPFVDRGNPLERHNPIQRIIC